MTRCARITERGRFKRTTNKGVVAMTINARISMSARRGALALATRAVVCGIAAAAFAEDAPAVIDTGDTAWVLVSSALVLMMTLPGLALFYGGLVRSKNILNVLMQCFISAGIVGVLWIL